MPKLRTASPDHLEITITDRKKNDVGILTVKDYRILWKPKGERKAYLKTLKQFTDWITREDTKARRV
jgi:hypothetical protein